jgi:hypothetical protein
VNSHKRARSQSTPEWDRARRAYQRLIDGHDPAAALVEAGDTQDLRPSVIAPSAEVAPTLVAGPRDLQELRAVVERSLGVGTWPAAALIPGAEVVSTEISIEHPTALLGLLLAMEGLIEDRSPWRNWRSFVDTLAAAVDEIESVTVETQILRP